MKSKDKAIKTDKNRQRQIKVAMVKRGIVGAEIARIVGVRRQTVYNVVAGRRRNPKIVAALIEAGVPAKYFNEGIGHGKLQSQD